jgi:biopolymer transport protein ExbD
MAMNVGQGNGSGDPEVMMEMNTTPLIDVMLVLLVMLIITIPVQTHAVKLDMPTGNPPPVTTPPPVISLDIDFDGTITWNGQLVRNRQELEYRLKTEAADVANQPEVHIRPNKLVTYKYVAAVLASAQRLGANKIGIVGTEQFAN